MSLCQAFNISVLDSYSQEVTDAVKVLESAGGAYLLRTTGSSGGCPAVVRGHWTEGREVTTFTIGRVLSAARRFGNRGRRRDPDGPPSRSRRRAAGRFLARGAAGRRTQARAAVRASHRGSVPRRGARVWTLRTHRAPGWIVRRRAGRRDAGGGRAAHLGPAHQRSPRPRDPHPRPHVVMRILFIGDIFGRPGREITRQAVPALIERESIDLVVANVENAAAGFGITGDIAETILSYGVDVMTTGNHVWDKKEVLDYFPGHPKLLRPANFPAAAPGRGRYLAQTRTGEPVGVV